MSEKISIACPSCQKRYSVPADLGRRKLKCKACGTDFRLSDLLPQQATPAPTKQEPSFDSSLGNAGKSNFQGMFKPSLSSATPGGNVAGSNPYRQAVQPGLGRIEPPRIEHRKNSKMLLAIFASIFSCFLIIPACYFITATISSSYFKKGDQPQRRNQKQQVSTVARALQQDN